MKMLGELRKRKVETEYVRPITRIICDSCKKTLVDEYARVSTHHNLWGNDSHESYEYYDLCFECAIKMFTQYLQQPRKSEQFEYECVRVCVGEEKEMNENGNIDIFDRDEYKLEETKNGN